MAAGAKGKDKRRRADARKSRKPKRAEARRPKQSPARKTGKGAATAPRPLPFDPLSEQARFRAARHSDRELVYPGRLLALIDGSGRPQPLDDDQIEAIQCKPIGVAVGWPRSEFGPGCVRTAGLSPDTPFVPFAMDDQSRPSTGVARINALLLRVGILSLIARGKFSGAGMPSLSLKQRRFAIVCMHDVLREEANRLLHIIPKDLLPLPALAAVVDRDALDVAVLDAVFAEMRNLAPRWVAARDAAHRRLAQHTTIVGFLQAAEGLMSAAGQMAAVTRSIESLLGPVEPAGNHALKALNTGKERAVTAFAAFREKLNAAETLASGFFTFVRARELKPKGWDSEGNSALRLCGTVLTESAGLPWGSVPATRWWECCQRVQRLRDNVADIPIVMESKSETGEPSQMDVVNPAPETHDEAKTPKLFRDGWTKADLCRAARSPEGKPLGGSTFDRLRTAADVSRGDHGDTHRLFYIADVEKMMTVVRKEAPRCADRVIAAWQGLITNAYAPDDLEEHRRNSDLESDLR